MMPTHHSGAAAPNVAKILQDIEMLAVSIAANLTASMSGDIVDAHLEDQSLTENIPSLAARGAQARQNLVAALRECCELVDAIEHFEGDELLEALAYLDRLRYVMAESGQLLQGVTRGFAG
ncbi:MAG TPA: hypothetical protein VFL82_02350 [Thermomicrobiales bacterium]|nr:hypothetical protein [Thermomicrobiales bacterium]